MMHVLCVWTSERVLCTPLAGRNHLFQGFDIFSVKKRKNKVEDTRKRGSTSV